MISVIELELLHSYQVPFLVNSVWYDNGRCSVGVPEGSLLGYLLFSFYISDLLQVAHVSNMQMYADDTVTYTHAKTAELSANKLILCNAKDHGEIWQILS